MLPTPRDLKNTVQSFPPSTTMGGVWYRENVRGNYLPTRGSKERDRVLRLYDNDENNTLWQGVRSGFSKKIASVEYVIEGDDEQETQYYHDLLGNAHFGRGWQHFIKLIVRDFLSQSYGSVIEIAGYGNSWEPLPRGLPITAINHLDSGRCYFTGNPVYPVIYYSLWDGRLHKMHADRVYILVDDPDPDERYLGIGTCALERAIAISQREIRMAQYIETKLDDKPNPGVNVFSNLGEKQYQAAIANYLLDMQNDTRPVFGRTLNLFSVDPREPAKLESVSFSQPPDKFDWTQYVSIDVDMLALAFGTDRQEIWQLTGGNIGSGQQSEILAEKSRGKTFGDFLAAMERFMNWALLPRSCEAKLKDNDERKKKAQAEIDQMYAGIAQTLSQLPGVSAEMLLQMLANESETFKAVFTNEKGQIVLPIVDRQTPQQITSLDTATPVPEQQSALQQTPEGKQAQASMDSATQQPMQKSFNGTSATFKMRFTDIVSNGIARVITPAEFETLLLAALERAGRDALLGGLQEGGVNEISDKDEMSLMEWTLDQIDFIDSLKNEVYSGKLTQEQVPLRADMWSNKSLQSIREVGIVSANRDGMYIWQYGDTEHCDTCQRLNGQVHRYSRWYAKGLLPQSSRLDCGGYRCQCRLIKTDQPARGRF